MITILGIAVVSLITGVMFGIVPVGAGALPDAETLTYTSRLTGVVVAVTAIVAGLLGVQVMRR